MPTRYLKRVRKINELIIRKSTGPPKDLAKKIGVSESNIYKYLLAMKLMGAPIIYDKKRKTYLYKEQGDFIIEFQKFETIKIV